MEKEAGKAWTQPLVALRCEFSPRKEAERVAGPAGTVSEGGRSRPSLWSWRLGSTAL